MAVGAMARVGVGDHRDHQRHRASPVVAQAGRLHAGRRHGAYSADSGARAGAPVAGRVSNALMTNLTIRPEQPHDRDAVRLVNERAFGGTRGGRHRGRPAPRASGRRLAGRGGGHRHWSATSCSHRSSSSSRTGSGWSAWRQWLWRPTTRGRASEAGSFARDSPGVAQPASTASSCSATPGTTRDSALCRPCSLACGASTTCQPMCSWRSS